MSLAGRCTLAAKDCLTIDVPENVSMRGGYDYFIYRGSAGGELVGEESDAVTTHGTVGEDAAFLNSLSGNIFISCDGNSISLGGEWGVNSVAGIKILGHYNTVSPSCTLFDVPSDKIAVWLLPHSYYNYVIAPCIDTNTLDEGTRNTLVAVIDTTP